MEICLARFERPVMLALRDGDVYIDDVIQPIKNVTEEELERFNALIEAVPVSDDPGYAALLNARRSEFIISLLGRAVGEECVDLLTSILEQLHWSVLEYLGETGDADA